MLCIKGGEEGARGQGRDLEDFVNNSKNNTRLLEAGEQHDVTPIFKRSSGCCVVPG